MRILGIDLGQRRIGLAISDASQTLARPLATLTVDRNSSRDPRPADRSIAVDLVMAEITRLAGEDDGLAAIVVGVPAHLDGSASAATSRALAFRDALKACTSIPVITEDERLTSREAESRLAVNERDWRKRKAQLDAAAAAVILQDYLDRKRHELRLNDQS